MKVKGIEVGSWVPDKTYDSKVVYELIHIANCFPELRENGKKKFNTWRSIFKVLILVVHLYYLPMTLGGANVWSNFSYGSRVDTPNGWLLNPQSSFLILFETDSW